MRLVAETTAMAGLTAFQSLRYRRGYSWYPLPDWVHSFISVGAALTHQPADTHRTVVGMAVPTRAFAAAFTALGVVAALAHRQSGENRPRAHFDRLAALPAGTPVTVVSGSRRTKGVLRGCAMRDGRQLLRVQYSTRGDMHLLPVEESLRIQLTAAEAADLPGRPAPRAMRTRAGFAGRLFPGIDAHEFVTTSQLDCVLIGARNVLRQEIVGTRLAAAEPGTTPVSGTLQEIVRVRDFARGNDAYRSDLQAATGKHVELPAHLPAPVVTVFDGAGAYLRWRHLWRRSHLVVVLDRTEAPFDIAVQQLNQEFMRPDIAGADPPGLAAVPPGCELLIYQEPRR